MISRSLRNRTKKTMKTNAGAGEHPYNIKNVIKIMIMIPDLIPLIEFWWNINTAYGGL